jgi:hypothetical protein
MREMLFFMELSLFHYESSLAHHVRSFILHSERLTTGIYVHRVEKKR